MESNENKVDDFVVSLGNIEPIEQMEREYTIDEVDDFVDFLTNIEEVDGGVVVLHDPEINNVSISSFLNNLEDKDTRLTNNRFSIKVFDDRLEEKLQFNKVMVELENRNIQRTSKEKYTIREVDLLVNNLNENNNENNRITYYKLYK